MAFLISSKFIFNHTIKLYPVTRTFFIFKSRTSNYITLASNKCLKDCNNQCKQWEVHRSANASFLNIRRYAATPKPEPYELPPKKTKIILDSGDLEDSGISKMPKSTPIPGFDICEELKSADEMIKKIFSIDFADHRIKVDAKLQEIISSVQMHKYDYVSLEAQIAKFTILIRNLQERIKKSYSLKMFLNNMISNRQDLLKKLQSENYQKFLWLIDELKITYKTEFMPEIWFKRREKLTFMVEDKAEEIREKKLAEYANTLKGLQPDFQKRKAKLLAQISAEEHAIGTSLEDYMQQNIDYSQSKAAIYRANKTKHK